MFAYFVIKTFMAWSVKKFAKLLKYQQKLLPYCSYCGDILYFSQLGLFGCYYVEVFREFRKRFLGKRSVLFKPGQWHFHQDNAPVHNSILVTDYLTKMGIKTVPHPPYSPDLSPCDFCLFPKLKEKFRGCRYETIEEMKEAVTKVIDTVTQEDNHGAFQKLLEQYNKQS